ncbi:hypothetical protein AB0P36_23000 [Streptomyces flavidovirens]
MPAARAVGNGGPVPTRTAQEQATGMRGTGMAVGYAERAFGAEWLSG